VLLAVVVVVYQYGGSSESQVPVNGNLNVTLLANAGVIIETADTRIYIDPIELPQEYGDKLADIVLITHDHGDHYQYASINLIQKDETVNIFPEIMTTEINRHNGVGINPEEEVTIEDTTIKGYYMYTLSPDGVTPASHPRESNYTSYIIDINGFVLFHAGDSKNIPEYETLEGLVDVVFLPLGPGCQTMYGDEVVQVVQVIQPDYMIPIHYTSASYRSFNSMQKRSIESTTNCTVCSLEEFTKHCFMIE